MSTYYVAGLPYSSELYHHGIKGQKWGIRRFQNPDGTYTASGKDRYYKKSPLEKMAAKDAQRMSDANAAYGEGAGTRRKLINKELSEKLKNPDYAKAYEEAQKNVDVAKSLKRAERLHRNSGTFVRGRDLADRGYTHAQNALKTAAGMGISALTTTGTTYYITQMMGLGHKAAGNVALSAGAITAASIAAKSIRDAHSYNYYERNRKF